MRDDWIPSGTPTSQIAARVAELEAEIEATADEDQRDQARLKLEQAKYAHWESQFISENEFGAIVQDDDFDPDDYPPDYEVT